MDPFHYKDLVKEHEILLPSTIQPFSEDWELFPKCRAKTQYQAFFYCLFYSKMPLLSCLLNQNKSFPTQYFLLKYEFDLVFLKKTAFF